MEKGEIILYQPNETIKLEVRLEEESVWLTQAQMAELFQTTPQNITIQLGVFIKKGNWNILQLVRNTYKFEKRETVQFKENKNSIIWM